MKKIKFEVLIFVLAFSIVVFPSTATAQKKSQQNIAYAVTEKNVRLYTYSGSGKKKRFKYIKFAKKLPGIYFKLKTVVHHNVRYIKLTSPNFQKINTHRISVYKSQTFYIKQKFVRPTNATLWNRNYTVEKYHLISKKYHFWNRPPMSTKSTQEVAMPNQYEHESLLVDAAAKTHSKRKYYRVLDKKHKKIGWIYYKAVKKGSYLEPNALLRNNSIKILDIWKNPNLRTSEVMVYARKGKTEISVQNSNLTADVITINNGKPVNVYSLSLSGKKIQKQKYRNKMIIGDISQTHANHDSSRFKFVVSTHDLRNVTHIYNLEINLMTGKISMQNQWNGAVE